MLLITKNKDDLIIREIPNILLIAIIVSLLISLLFASLLVLNKAPVSVSMLFGSILFFASSIAVSLPLTTVKLNVKSKLITIKNYSLIKKTFEVYNFTEVADLIHVQEINDSNEYKICKLIMPLKSGDKIEIFKAATFEIVFGLSPTDAGKYFNAANFMNDIIFESDFKLSAFNET